MQDDDRAYVIGKFAYGIIHDFNNTLNIIGVRCHLLLEQLKPNHSIRKEIELILSASENATRFTRQLLNFSQCKSLEKERIDVKALLTQMMLMLRPLLGESVQLKLRSKLKKSKVEYLEMNRGQFEQMILNLVINAKDAMPQGGMLTIHVQTVQLLTHTKVNKKLTAGPYLEISVQDTGIGMSSEVLSKIFDPFFSTKAHGKATGLGLSVVREVIESEGGQISVESELQKGTRFLIHLPLVRSKSQKKLKKTTVSKRKSLRGNETVLLIEDDERLRDSLAKVLEKKGYTVVIPASLNDLGEFVKEYSDSIDLLVADFILPRMSGIQVFEKVRAVQPQIKVLYMSGYPIELTPSLEPIFISKPFPPNQLLEKIREVLEPKL